MLATALSAMLFGLDAHPIRVEVEAARGVPSFELVGLAETAVRESRVRVKSALLGVGVDICECAIVVNMAPADVRKAGSGFDLAIAVAACCALRAAPVDALEGVLFLGELSLTGRVDAVRGVLPQLLGARARGVARAVVPRANAAEASVVEGIDVRTVETLGELVAALRGEGKLPRAEGAVWNAPQQHLDDLSEVRGQASARRALEIAAAGNHNLLMIGPPGSGKNGAPTLSRARPFRAPHHTVSDVGLIGGGEVPRPGEVSLAHGGVLFLDELPEFRRSALEAMRQPLEDGIVSIARARARATFPARPMLVCAMNPCACGYLGDSTHRCACTLERIRAYRARLSGPIVDRIDVHVVLPPVTVTALQQTASGEPTSAVRARVERARTVQRDRVVRGEVSSFTNASLLARELDVARLCPEGTRIVSAAVSRLALSARAYGKVLRVARTIADLEGEARIGPGHVAEAIGLRALDRGATSSASNMAMA
jgi:magnesium chelatase family protein